MRCGRIRPDRFAARPLSLLAAAYNPRLRTSLKITGCTGCTGGRRRRRRPDADLCDVTEEHRRAAFCGEHDIAEIPDGDGTRVTVVTDLTITGKVAQFGRGVLADVSGKLLGQFVDNLERDVLSAGAAHSTIGWAYLKQEKTAASVPELKAASTLLKGQDDHEDLHHRTVDRQRWPVGVSWGRSRGL